MTTSDLPKFQNLKEQIRISNSFLYSEDFAPTIPSAHNWTTWNFASLWIGMAVCIPTYMLAGSMIREGMNWWQALLTILLGNLIVLYPMSLSAVQKSMEPPMLISTLQKPGYPLKDSTVKELAALVNVRLSYMKDVAAYKWINQLPVEDLVRERKVIQSSIEKAREYQLDPVFTESFFRLQIKAAKTIQQYWFDHWKARGFDPNLQYRDLQSEIRPALLELGDKILLAIVNLNLREKTKASLSKDGKHFINTLTSEGLTTRIKRRLFRSAVRINR